jgi:hypothetical protein
MLGFAALGASALSAPARADLAPKAAPSAGPTTSCGVPVCDIPGLIAQMRSYGMGGSVPTNTRFVMTNNLRTQAQATNDLASLMNLADAAAAIRALFVELGEDDWMVRDADYLSNDCYTKLCVAPAATIDQLISFYHRSGAGGGPASDGVRFSTLQFWKTQVDAATTKARLVDLNRYFVYAASDSTANANWVLQQAQIGSDAAVEKLLSQFTSSLSVDEMNTYFHEIVSDGTRYDTLGLVTTVADSNPDAGDLLVKLSQFFAFAATDSAGHASYIVDRANASLQDVNVTLIKRPTIDSTQMMKYFVGVGTDAARSDVLSYWRVKYKKVLDKHSLLELGRFFYLAKLDCRSKQNATWVQTTASGGETDLIARLSELFPVMEGSYDLKASCLDNAGNPVDSDACGASLLDHLVVLNVGGSEGWQVQLLNQSIGTSAFGFQTVTLSRGGTGIDALSNSNGLLSQLTLDFDPTTGIMRGTVTNSDREGKIALLATLDGGTVGIYDAQAALDRSLLLPATQVQNTLSGTYAGQKAKLTISSIPMDKVQLYSGTLTLDDFPGTSVNFQSGDYDPQTGVLTLVQTNDQTADHIKVAIGLHTDSSTRVQASGIAIRALDGSVRTLSMQSTPVGVCDELGCYLPPSPTAAPATGVQASALTPARAH